MARRRPLRPEEIELWQAVARTARPMHPHRPRAEPAPPPVAEEPKPHAQPRLPHFHIGERVAPAPPQAAQPPLRMDAKTHTRMLRGKLAPESRIDLHGMTLAEAHPELVRFILNAHGEGKRLVLVITGKGKRGEDFGPIPQRMGALRHQVPQWLALPPLGSAILQVTTANLKHGGAGAYYVYLRRGR